MPMFDIDGFVAVCLEALTDADPAGAVGEAMERAMAQPRALAARFPVPVDADDDGILYRSPEVFIACAIFPKGFATGIHNHATQASSVCGLATRTTGCTNALARGSCRAGRGASRPARC